MENNINYTIVGIFVVSLVTLIILSIIWLSSGIAFTGYSIYKIYMQESVSGLNSDSNVEFNGVVVGSVKKIEIDQNKPNLVIVLISIKEDTPVTQGTRATLNTKGLTGIAFISLKDKGIDKTPLKRIPPEPYPVINTSPSLLLQLDAALSSLNGQFTRISEALQKLLSDENQRNIKNIMQNLEIITHVFASNSDQLNQILKNTNKATSELTPTIRSFKNETIPATNQLIINLNNLSSQLENLTSDIKQNPALLIRGSQPNTLGPGER